MTEGTQNGRQTSPGSERRVLIVGNPYSGLGSNTECVNRLCNELEAHGTASQVVWEAEHATTLLDDPALQEWCRCVVAAGGDGTLAMLINRCPGVPVAVLPLGTENLFAKQFRFHRDPRELARRIMRGDIQRIDVAAAAGHRFTLMLTAGFDADVVHRLHAWRKEANKTRRISHLSYIPHLLKSMRQYEFPTFDLETDDGTIHDGTQLFIFNMPVYCLHLPVCTFANPKDGLLDWIVLKGPGISHITSFAMHTIVRRHLRRRDVAHGRSGNLRIIPHAELPMQVDGDPVEFEAVQVRCMPEAMSVLSAPD